MKKNLRNKLAIPTVIGSHWHLATFTRTSTLLALFGLLIMLVGCNTSETAHTHDTYTCPMHPTVISDQPGTCPVCGMDLVRKALQGEEVKITEDLSKLLKSPNQVIVASIETIKGDFKSVPVTVQAQGVVTYDTRNIYTIPARVGGRLEKIALKYTFQEVSKGQKIAEIYSPELITAQRELLFVLEHDSENQSLISGAKTKLELLGMSTNQINALVKRKEASNTISVYSPYSGYLISGQATSTATAAPSAESSGMEDGMRASTSSPASSQGQIQTTPTGSLVREGDYVTAGQTLFTVVNNNALRIELNLPSAYNGSVTKGSKVELRFGKEHVKTATVDFVQPFFGEGEDFVKIRVYTHETEGLHIGHLVNATLHLNAREALWLPKEAVLMLGIQKVVFVKDGGVFKPKAVTTGLSSNGMIEIKDGLASSDEVASNAQFLVDSESFIKPVN